MRTRLHGWRRFFVFLLLTILLPSTQIFAATDRPEFRGIWVITWEIYQPKNGTPLQGGDLKARIREILDHVQEAGLNTVLWQVRQSGTAYYASPYEPWGKYLGRRSPGFDPLSFAIEEAHARGLALHAWVNTFEAFDSAPGTPSVTHPEWVVQDSLGRRIPKNFSLSPGLPEVREYLKTILFDLVDRYRVDGIHLDYVRWNEARWADFTSTAGFGDFLFDAEHPSSAGVPAGYDSWEDWRRDGVTTLVRETGQLLHARKPSLVFSVAAIGRYNWGVWNGYDAVFQDPALWLNEGYIDQIMGMNYEFRTGTAMFDGLAGKCPECWQVNLQKAISAGRCYTAGVGSQMLRTSGQWDRHTEIVDAIRRVPWDCGMQFFSYGDWEKTDFFATAKELFFSSPLSFQTY